MRDAINSIFCDYDSAFNPQKDVFMKSGYNFPQDFEDAESIGSARFQFINDLKSGLCLFNHDGNLYPFTQRKILQRKLKVKESVVIERFGDRNPFSEDRVYFVETGLNLGNVEYLIFDYSKEKRNSFSSFRKVLYIFPLFWLMREVLVLKEMVKKKDFSLERIQELENEKILSHEKLNLWPLMSRDTSPSADQYRERVEFPLEDYHFQRNGEVDIWLKFGFFGT